MKTKIQNGFEMVRFDASSAIDCEFNRDDDRLIVYAGGARHYIYPDGTIESEVVDGSTYDDLPLADDDRQVPEQEISC